MKKFSIFLLVVFLTGMIAAACGPKPAYKTREGKKKLKYYNDLRYRGD